MRRIIGYTLALFLGVAFLAALYGTIVIFGFWKTLLFIMAAITLLFIANQMGGSRKETGNTIVYNPAEWPNYIALGIILIAGIYSLFKIANTSAGNLPDWLNEWTGALVLLFAVAAPYAYIYKYAKSRKDSVKISDDKIEFYDNNNFTTLPLSDIQSCTIEKINGHEILEFSMQDESKRTINLDDLNFNAKDIKNLKADLEKLLPKKENISIKKNEKTQGN